MSSTTSLQVQLNAMSIGENIFDVMDRAMDEHNRITRVTKENLPNKLSDLTIALAKFNQENALAQQEEVTNAARLAQNLPYTGVPHASLTFNLNEKVMYLAERILKLSASDGLDDAKRKQVQDIFDASRKYFGEHC